MAFHLDATFELAAGQGSDNLLPTGYAATLLQCCYLFPSFSFLSFSSFFPPSSSSGAGPKTQRI